jgi:hypothetical protein
MKIFLTAGTCLVALMMPAHAEGISDWRLGPYETEFSGLNLHVAGSAQGTATTAFQPSAADLNKTGVSGAATLTADLTREYDSGMELALKTAFQLAHDRLSGDNYGNDLVQKVYGAMRTGLGTVEVGMNDGVAYSFAITGPVVDAEVSLDNPNATFFRNPTTKRAFIEQFALNSAVEPSYNYAKLSYYTPMLFGVRIGVSYTPSIAKDVLPFVSSGPRLANRQESIWETAVNYRDSFGNYEVGFSGTAAFAHLDEGMRTPGHRGLADWALGLEIARPIGEDMKFSLGGAYHRSNAYGFDLFEVETEGETNSAHISAKIERGPFSFGIEYGDGNAVGASGKTGVRGYQVAGGYKITDNLSASLGWQELRYADGAFYNGRPRINMDAVFLHLHFEVQ